MGLAVLQADTLELEVPVREAVSWLLRVPPPAPPEALPLLEGLPEPVPLPAEEPLREEEAVPLRVMLGEPLREGEPLEVGLTDWEPLLLGSTLALPLPEPAPPAPAAPPAELLLGEALELGSREGVLAAELAPGEAEVLTDTECVSVVRPLLLLVAEPVLQELALELPLPPPAMPRPPEALTVAELLPVLVTL
jgi:hypothetical protein